MVWIAAFTATVLLVLYFIFFYDNGFSGFTYITPTTREPEARSNGSMKTVIFPARDGQSLEGWLYLPNGKKPPLIIMAPGLTGTKEGPLEQFAWRFAEEGIAVLSLDFRTFGGSMGFPRHWMDPFRQMEDYESAIEFVKSHLSSEVDINRIVLWGTSFSGGVAISVAGNRTDITAIIVQAPYLETSKELEPSRSAMIRYIAWTTLDLIRSQLASVFSIKLQPVYIPVYGKPGEFAFAPSMENPSRTVPFQSGSLFWQTMPSKFRGGWENKMTARFLADFDRFKPMDNILKIKCPIYLIGGEEDDMVPVVLMRKAFDRIPIERKRLTMHACRHFGLYTEPVFSENVNLQVQFIKDMFSTN